MFKNKKKQTNIFFNYKDIDATYKVIIDTSQKSSPTIDFKKAMAAFEKAAEAGNPMAECYIGKMYERGYGVKQKFKKAHALYLSAANQGIVMGQNNLGRSYQLGQGVSIDYDEAMKWYRKAAEQGHANAQYNLGWMYESGKGVPIDHNKAVEWFRKAAEQEHADAQNTLGWMYENGKGVPIDHSKAVEWFRKASDLGSAMAQYNLGYKYSVARGVKQSYSEALKWYRKAAEQEHANAQNELGRFYQLGQGVSIDYHKAVEWYRKSADLGAAAGQSNLGWMYEKGKGVSQDYKEAVKWYLKAAEQGYMRAQYNLGWAYQKGQGIRRSYKKAVKWHLKAAEQGHMGAQYDLGLMYKKGQGIRSNFIEAAKWYRKAAEQGHTNAQINLGNMYSKGHGVLRNDAEAAKWNHKAAEQGNAIAQHNLGLLCKQGRGVEVDYNLAAFWFRKAAAQGYNQASVSLNKLLREMPFLAASFTPQATITPEEINNLTGTVTNAAPVKAPNTPPKKLSEQSIHYVDNRKPSKRAEDSSRMSLSASYMISYKELSFNEGDILGRGAFGVVYTATYQHAPVAVKQLTAKLTTKTFNEVKKEAKIMANLHHPNVVTFYGISENEENQLSLVMELMPKGSLFDLLHNEQKLPWKLRFSIALDITAGLAHLHEQNILHHDLKSLNVLLDNNLRAKLTDFGLSDAKSEVASASAIGASNTKGTIAWLPPESFKRNASYTKPSDVYSLGMIFWELASREIPFKDAQSPEITMMWIKDGEQETIPEKTPKRFAQLIKLCWDKEPKKRPSVDDVATSIEAAREARKKSSNTRKLSRSSKLSNKLRTNSSNESEKTISYQGNLNSGM